MDVVLMGEATIHVRLFSKVWTRVEPSSPSNGLCTGIKAGSVYTPGSSPFKVTSAAILPTTEQGSL